MSKLYIIIPAYNEEERIRTVIKRAKKYSKNIVLVDDGSSDNTVLIGEEEKIITLKHMVNLGKGAALKTGCDYAAINGATEMIVIDADGQHKPEDIPRFIKALDGHDIVFGSRVPNENMPTVLKFGNVAISILVSILYGVKIKDTQSGFRAFTNKAYQKIRWDATDYSMESEMITKVGKHKLKHNEIIIDTIYNDDYKGTTIIDGIKIVLSLMWWKIIGR